MPKTSNNQRKQQYAFICMYICFGGNLFCFVLLLLTLVCRNDGSKVDATSVLTLGTSIGEMSDTQLDSIDKVTNILFHF